jgi:hypothetical protein
LKKLLFLYILINQEIEMEEIVDNKYCFECENRVGKKKSGEWNFYTEVMGSITTYNVITHELDDISFYTCLDCYADNISWECKKCNQIIDSTDEFCDELGSRKCMNCIIEEVANDNMECKCNVCRELFEMYTISLK